MRSCVFHIAAIVVLFTYIVYTQIIRAEIWCFYRRPRSSFSSSLLILWKPLMRADMANTDYIHAKCNYAWCVRWAFAIPRKICIFGTIRPNKYDTFFTSDAPNDTNQHSTLFYANGIQLWFHTFNQMQTRTLIGPCAAHKLQRSNIAELVMLTKCGWMMRKNMLFSHFASEIFGFCVRFC